MNRKFFRFFLASTIVAALIAAAAGCGSQQVDIPGSQVTFNYIVPVTSLNTRLKSLVNTKLVAKPATDLYKSAQEDQILGRIELPSIGIKEWLVEGTEKDALTLGVGHMVNTSVPGMGGNFAIAGDRVLYTVPLLRIDKLQVGDPINIYMPYATFRYQVESITTVDPSEVQILDPKGYESVTMISCDPTWQLFTRLAVSAKLVDSTPTV
jgi:LPXTG-site transpeptidase (sortase) family protein